MRKYLFLFSILLVFSMVYSFPPCVESDVQSVPLTNCTASADCNAVFGNNYYQCCNGGYGQVYFKRYYCKVNVCYEEFTLDDSCSSNYGIKDNTTYCINDYYTRVSKYKNYWEECTENGDADYCHYYEDASFNYNYTNCTGSNVCYYFGDGAYCSACHNSVKDGHETQVDYGGGCGTCFNGILNDKTLGELDIDYGGVCIQCRSDNNLRYKDRYFENFYYTGYDIPFNSTLCPIQDTKLLIYSLLPIFIMTFFILIVIIILFVLVIVNFTSITSLVVIMSKYFSDRLKRKRKKSK